MTDGEGTTDLNDSLPVLTMVQAEEAEEVEGNDEKRYIMNDALNLASRGPFNVLAKATRWTKLTERTTAELLTK